ncbi:MAG: RNA-binding S4 domain-containing protein [Pseudohongiellaceae bacterium]
MRDIELTRVPVELFKILKFEGLAGSGAEAKTLIAEGQVLLNGVVETRKRKQIVGGDIIELDGEKLRMVDKAGESGLNPTSPPSASA